MFSGRAFQNRGAVYVKLRRPYELFRYTLFSTKLSLSLIEIKDENESGAIPLKIL